MIMGWIHLEDKFLLKYRTGYRPDPWTWIIIVLTTMPKSSVSTINGREKTGMRETGVEVNACLMATNAD